MLALCVPCGRVCEKPPGRPVAELKCDACGGPVVAARVEICRACGERCAVRMHTRAWTCTCGAENR